MARVTMESVIKRFGAVTAADNIDLCIEDGEFFALLGPSGCGKTTTLRLVAGLEKPNAGRIMIGDRDVTALSPRDRDVAMVFQDYALYPHMTLLENIGYPLKVRRVPSAQIRERVTEVAASLQIGQLLDRRPAQLSGGQQQRASVARALVHQPQVFLFDEPLSNLDAKLRIEARAFLRHLQQEVGITAIYVTHDQAEAMALADRIAIMEAGRIVQIGEPLKVYQQPRTTFVAGFIGSPPMNLIPCRLEQDAITTSLAGEGFRLDISSLRDRLPRDLGSGQEILLGIRPEHISLADSPRPQSIPGQLYVVQALGAETLVNLLVGGATVSVRIFSDEPLRLSGQVWIKPDLQRAQLYGASGELIL